MKRTELVKHVRCAIYTRFSTEEQRQTSATDKIRTTTAQVAECMKRVAAEDGWHLVMDPFSDEGISGYATANRPAYNAMYEVASNKDFDVLLVNDLSRLARSTDVDPIVRRFRFRRVRVIGVQDGFDSDSPIASMQAGFSGITSQQTIDMVSKRTHAELERIVTENPAGNPGGRPYGYAVKHVLHPTEKDKYSGQAKVMAKRLEKDPAEAAVVKRIFTMFADEGLSTTAIAARLNAEGVPSPGSSWTRTVRRKSGWMASSLSSDPKRGCGILNNQIYRGILVWNRTVGCKDPDSGKIEYRPRSKDEWKTEDRPHLKIIDDDLWDRVRKRQELRRRVRGDAISLGITTAKRIGGKDPRYLLGGILKCGSCGARMIGDSRRDFVCPSYASGGCDNDLRVRRDKVHAALMEPLNEYLLNDELVAKVKTAGEPQLRALIREEEKAAKQARPSKDMKRLDEQEAALRALSLPTAAMNAALAAIEGERQEIKAKASGSATPRISRARALLAKVPQIMESYRELIENGAKALTDRSAVSAAREALRQLLVDGSLVLTPNARHTALVGAVRFADLGEHILGLAGVKRRVKHLDSTQTHTSHVTVVAGAGFSTLLMSISRKTRA
jgi:site-specific DNA recombinase